MSVNQSFISFLGVGRIKEMFHGRRRFKGVLSWLMMRISGKDPK
jgi:hypothetical protein